MTNKRTESVKKVLEDIRDVHSRLSAIKDEEEEAYDNTPESLWDTDRYERSGDALEAMESAADSLQEAIDSLEEIVL